MIRLRTAESYYINSGKKLKALKSVILWSSDWISMNLFLFCSSRCQLQNKKKIFKIGLVYHEIIAKTIFSGSRWIWNFKSIWNQKKWFFAIISWSSDWISNIFFLFWRGYWGPQNKKKFIEIPLLDHKITLFNAFNFFPRIYIVTLCRS